MTARRLLQATSLTIAAGLALTACAASQEAASAGSGSVGASQAASTIVGDLPVQNVANVPALRLADDLAPPTNHWFSGLVFPAEAQPVFPFPLAFATDASTFTIDLPEVVATEKTIAAPFAGGLTVDVGADAFEVVRYDAVSVTLRYFDGSGAIGDVTIAEGSPIVSFVAARDTELRPGAKLDEVRDGLWELTAEGIEYGVAASGATATGGSLALSSGDSAQWFAVPADSTVSAWGEAIGDPITAVSTQYELDGENARTRLTYDGTDSSVVVPFPGRDQAGDCDLGTFETAYGPTSACAGTTLEWTVPHVEANANYDLDGISDETRAEITASLTSDLDNLPATAADTYFGGKGLARVATLLTIAQSVEDEALVESAADELWAQLEPWVQADGCEQRDERCFVYDDELHMVVGLGPSFGSEEGNDHHFHYGYFLFAAAVLADARPEVADQLAPIMDVLAADIAAGTEDGALPTLRVFDPYRAHSWASGFSPFADGNNQESSSEAVAAWNGLALWAQVSGQEELSTQAEWMLSAEAEAARSLWLEPDLEFADGYDHGIVSLSWGGKRDYATWFSPEPSAILGIQVIPVTPVSLEYLAGSPERVAANIAEAGGEKGFAGPLGDQVLLYSALAGDEALATAKQAAQEMSDEELDDGNSRSAVLAWFAALEQRG